MADRCACPCHVDTSSKPVAERQRADGVSLYDVLEAEVACSRCKPRHSLALLSRLPANHPEPPDSSVWIDPPITKGEGDE